MITSRHAYGPKIFAPFIIIIIIITFDLCMLAHGCDNRIFNVYTYYAARVSNDPSLPSFSCRQWNLVCILCTRRQLNQINSCSLLNIHTSMVSVAAVEHSDLPFTSLWYVQRGICTSLPMCIQEKENRQVLRVALSSVRPDLISIDRSCPWETPMKRIRWQLVAI